MGDFRCGVQAAQRREVPDANGHSSVESFWKTRTSRQGRRHGNFTELAALTVTYYASRTAEGDPLRSKNAIAIVVIILVLAGGAMALYRLDTGEGTRTSQSVAAKTASD
jgi:hypothetical protein